MYCTSTLIVKVKLNVWHLHRSIIAMFVYTVCLFSCSIVISARRLNVAVTNSVIVESVL